MLVAIHDDDTARALEIGRRAQRRREQRNTRLQFWAMFVRQMLSDNPRYK